MNFLNLKKTRVLIMCALLVSATVFAAKPQKELYEGITKGDMARIQKAIDEGADVNKAVSMKKPLIWALETTHRKDIIKLLIDKGADVNAADPIKGSILMQYAGFVETPEARAQWYNDFYKKYKVDTVISPSQYSSILEVTHLLLDAGANPNFDMGTIIGTPLQSTITFGIGSEEARAQFIKALLTHPKNPADPNDRMRTSQSVSSNSAGFKTVDKEKHPTPLMYALQKGYTKIAAALIEGGADVNITMNTYKMSSDMWGTYNNKNTITALDIAKNKGLTDMEQMLIKAGAQ